MLLHHWMFWSSHYKNENSSRSELPRFTDSRALCLLERFDKWLEFVNWSIVLRFQRNNKVDQRDGKEQTGSQEKNEVICLNKMRTSKNNKQRVQVHSLPFPPTSNPDIQMKFKNWVTHSNCVSNSRHPDTWQSEVWPVFFLSLFISLLQFQIKGKKGRFFNWSNMMIKLVG